MSNSEERIMILKMLEDGKISSEEQPDCSKRWMVRRARRRAQSTTQKDSHRLISMMK